MGAMTTLPLRTTGRSAIRPTLRIATSGWFTTGVWNSPASFPALVIVNVEPLEFRGLQRSGPCCVRQSLDVRT